LPGLWDIIENGDGNDWRRLIVSVAISTPCLAVTVFVALRHQGSDILASPPSRRRRYYRILHAFPMVVAIACWLQIVAPRVAVVAIFCQEVWEAFALFYFSSTIISLLGGPEDAVKLLEGLPPRGLFGSKNRWCVPPLCCVVPAMPCFFRDGAEPFQKRLLARIRITIRQYCVVAPVTVFLVDGLLISERFDMPVFGAVLEGLQTVSMTLCLHALFMLYQATRDVLHRYHTTAKFMTIKSMILLSLVQKIVVTYVVASGVLPTASKVISTSDCAIRLQALLLLLELPFLQVVVNKAFPAEELQYDNTSESQRAPLMQGLDDDIYV